MLEKNLLLLDSFALAFRMFYAYSQTPLKNSRDEDVSIMHGYWGAVLRILDKYKPTHFAIARDTAHCKTFRHELYPDYKANRGPMPEEMVKQIALLDESMQASGISLLMEPGYEADDVMASTAIAAVNAGFNNVVIISKDKDMSQIVSDKIHLLHLQKGADGINLGPKEVFEKYGLYPEKIRDYLALMGDASDNVPGVPKVGPKTAIQLLNVFGDIDNIYANIDKITKKALRENLINNKEKAFLSRELVTLQTKRAFSGSIDALEYNGLHVDALAQIFKDNEIFSLLRLLEKIPSKTNFENNKAQQTTIVENIKQTYICVNTSETFEQLKSEFLNTKIAAIELFTDSDNSMQCNLVGIAMCANFSTSYYVPFSHSSDIGFMLPVTENGNFDLNIFTDWFKKFWEEFSGIFIFSNAKFKLHVILRTFKIQEQEIYKKHIADTIVAAWMLTPGQIGLNLENQVMQRLHYEIPQIETLTGRGKNQISFNKVQINDACNFSAQRVTYILKLWETLNIELKKFDYEKYFFKMEMPALKVLLQMETVGVSIDVPALNNLSVALNNRIQNLQSEICNLAGQEFNTSSPKQLSEVLFDTLKLPQIKKRSTDANVLEELSYKAPHPIVFNVIEYRELNKMQNTYVTVLPALINPFTKRIHTSFIQWGTATGRLSSRDPNLQNIPVRSDLGKQIRAAFVPQNTDNVILAVDYSQIELRMLAHLSADETLIESYKNGVDIHARTAAAIYGVTLDNVTSDMRRNAKVVNFGILYGMTAFRLSRDLKIPMAQAREFIEGYFDMYKGVQRFVEQTKIEAHKNGYVQTLSGRRRYITGLDSNDHIESQMAERMAVNTPVQGSAADLIKIAMIRIQNRINAESLPLKMMLQVHDELVFECPQNCVEAMAKMVKTEMEHAMELKVPLVASVGFGKNWLIAH